METAINLLKMDKLSPDEITLATGLTIDEVLELKEQITVRVWVLNSFVIKPEKTVTNKQFSFELISKI